MDNKIIAFLHTYGPTIITSSQANSFKEVIKNYFISQPKHMLWVLKTKGPEGPEGLT